jgi:hypothetical protein
MRSAWVGFQGGGGNRLQGVCDCVRACVHADAHVDVRAFVCLYAWRTCGVWMMAENEWLAVGIDGMVLTMLQNGQKNDHAQLLCYRAQC